MTTDAPDPKMIEWLASLSRVIQMARLVSTFDGTDRASLDALRDALCEFTLLDEEVQRDNN